MYIFIYNPRINNNRIIDEIVKSITVLTLQYRFWYVMEIDPIQT